MSAAKHLSPTEVTEALAFLRGVATRAMGAGLRRHEAPSDIVQSAFREFLLLAESHEAADMVAPPKRQSLLARLALHKIVNRIRYHGVRSRHRTEAAQERAGTSADPAALAALRERVEHLRQTMERLPADYREILALSYFERLPHREIAARLGRSEDACKMLLSRAVAHLARELVAHRPIRDVGEHARPARC